MVTNILVFLLIFQYFVIFDNKNISEIKTRYLNYTKQYENMRKCLF